MELLNAKKKWSSYSIWKIAAIYFLLSFLGWIIEKVFFFIAYNDLIIDRGFLSLPFCPIYGSTAVFVYLFFGTPKTICAQLGIKNLPYTFKVWLPFLIYFFLSAFAATSFELFTGLFFDYFFDLRLWSYFCYPFNYDGYICLQYSLAWGGIITVFMGCVWNKLYHLITKIPEQPLAYLDLFLGVIFIINFTQNILSLF